jgi:hemerythrin
MVSLILEEITRVTRNRIPTLPDGIAAQHGHIARSIRNLRLDHEAGADWDEIALALDTLLADVGQHFSTEERAMEEATYPRLETHRAQHASFLERLQRLRPECERRQTELLPVLLELLETWFANHEQTMDRHAEEFLAAAE